MSVRAYYVLGLLIPLLGAFGCAPKAGPPAAPAAPTPPKASDLPADKTPVADVALGEQIYTKGIGASGQHIAFTKGTTQFKAKPGGCADCHGADGKGKELSADLKSPPICYSDLCMPRGDKPAMYDEGSLNKPAVQGLDEEGKPMEDAMPRWKLTDAELAALVAYLKTLDAKASSDQKAGSGEHQPE